MSLNWPEMFSPLSVMAFLPSMKIGAAGVMGLAGAFLVLSTYVKISNLAMKGSVWGIVIAGLVGLTSALITAYKTSATFRKFVDDAFKKVKEAWAAVSSFFTEKIPETFNTVKDWFRTNWQEIAALISGPFFPLVAMATDAFGIRSAFMGAVHKLIGWVGGAASSVSKNFKRGLMAVAWDFPQLIYTRIIAPVIAGYRTLLGKAMELSRAVPRGIQAVFWNLIQLYRERIVWPLHNLGASVLSKGKDFAGQIMTGSAAVAACGATNASNCKKTVNLGSATIKGVEAHASWQFVSGQWLRAGYSRVRGENDDLDEPLFQMPADEVSLGWLGNVMPGVKADFTLRLVDDQDRIATQFTKGSENATAGFATADLGATWQVDKRNSLRFAVKNLADKAYHEHLTEGVSGNEILAVGRSFQMSWKGSF